MPRYDVPKAAPDPLRIVQLFINSADLENEQEWLATPSELVRWFREHDISLDGAVSDGEVRRVVDVREALRALVRANNGASLPSAALSTLNHAFRAARVEFELDSSGLFAPTATAPGVDGAVGVVLGKVVEAMYDGSWARLKACRNCRWVFYDYSTNRSARWCSMALCGNRSKTRAYRGRRRASPPEARG